MHVCDFIERNMNSSKRCRPVEGKNAKDKKRHSKEQQSGEKQK